MSATHIVEKHPEWLYAVTDMAGNIVKSNESFKEFTIHIRPRQFFDIVTDKKDLDYILEAIEKAKAKKGEPVRFLCQTKNIDSVPSWGRWYVYCFTEKLFFAGSDRNDIHSISTHEASFTEKTLQFVNHVLNHDIRQPLSSINGVVDMLVEEGTKEEMILLTQKDNFEMLSMVKGSVDELKSKVDMLIKKVGRETRP